MQKNYLSKRSDYSLKMRKIGEKKKLQAHSPPKLCDGKIAFHAAAHPSNWHTDMNGTKRTLFVLT